jgi:DNA-binding MarR family transcriptional regulator
MDFRHSIGYLLHELAQLIQADSNQTLQQRLGIGFAQFKVLMVLEERDGQTQKQIAASLHQTQASISRQIKLLVDKKLVVAKVSASNRREHFIFLTKQGQEMVSRAARDLNNYHAPMFEYLSETQQLKITKTLELIRTTLER